MSAGHVISVYMHSCVAVCMFVCNYAFECACVGKLKQMHASLFKSQATAF